MNRICKRGAECVCTEESFCLKKYGLFENQRKYMELKKEKNVEKD